MFLLLTIIAGGSAGLSSSVRPSHRSPGRPRASSSGGEGSPIVNGIIISRSGARVRAVMPDHWEQAFSDPGESHYIDRNPKTSSWQSPRALSRETVYKNEWFTDQPEELRGFPVHTLLTKGSRGFGFNIVGGSRLREFLQVYSVTSSGPSALKTADILVYINDVCVLGVSHKEVVEMLKSVPVGHSVDVEVRRGYPMLYNPDGCPKQPPPRLMDSGEPILPPTTTQPHQLPRLPTPTPQHFTFNGVHSERSYMEPGVTLDANGNAMSFAIRQPPPYRRSSMSNAASSPPMRPPRSLRSLARLQSLDQNLASQSDSEVVSAIGSHRASMIRNHNNNSLSTPPHPVRYGTSKSSESDLSTCTLSGSRLPLPQSPRRPVSSPCGPRGAQSHVFRQQTSHLRPPPSSDSPYHRGIGGFHGNTSPTASPGSVSSPGALSVGSGGELVPVALAQAEGDRGLGFSVTAGGQGGRMTIVKRVWDRKQCNSLQPGDAIVKINGADIQSLSFSQVQTVLQEHTRQGEVVLLVYRGGIYHSAVSPGSARRLPPPLLRPPPPPVGSDDSSLLPETLPLPRTSMSTPSSPARTRSSLVQSTSFLESIPVTLTMEPKDWINTGLEDEAGGVTVPDSGLARQGGEQIRPLRGFDVELRRKPGEGFGFVIASQDVENGKAASLLPHRFVTVRRGSPAAKSGQIRPGDRLEAVEGRSVVTLPHRELAQILRRVGNSLRLTIVPRPSTYSSSLSETNEYDPTHKSRKGQKSRPKRDSRYYSVDLDRGPSGFGFSLRGGSEYNMGLYVLGLMEGGPASRSQKMQVSDQLVEINGDSTAGMTHSQAVEQIRRGGHRIHLVLKRGNGYVPDYGHERRIAPPSLLHHPKKQSLAAVDSTGQRGRSSKPKRRSRSSDGREKEKGTERRRRRRGASEGGGRSGLQSPVSESGDRSRDRRRRRKRESQSLPRDALRNHDDSDTEKGTVRGRKKEREGRRRRRSRSRGRKSKSREKKKEVEKEAEDEQQVPAVEEQVEVKEEEEQDVPAVEEQVEVKEEEEQDVPAVEEQVEVKEDEEEKVELERRASEENITLPIPSPNQKLPRPKQKWEAEYEENWDMAAEYRELRRQKELGAEQEQEQERSWEDDRGETRDTEMSRFEQDDDAQSGRLERPLPGVAVIDPVSQREPFSFLNSTLSVQQLEDDESEYGGSQSDSSVSAASISGLSLAGGRRAVVLPGPWLTPSQQRAPQVIGGNRHPEGQTRQRGGRGGVS
ncbi:membrane-associated guanylate kinase, WW and PDZ domain-containing protein 1 isoform X1 [Hippoglossus stenolepis]|uniref:membrane-associated guanylate kinase, WW and PDZ domain-containing protein 1 isoform X1 n=1 Tax=Hippoglossus stenolepis TaxID=195615 RepID=UPI001FB0205A|nr:membrane-associated guanylate kinase, WW and PDZ domain-containing protein 1 isoform X1 [Hippoglossus stenolepis]